MPKKLKSWWRTPKPVKLVIGKEYEVLQQFATLEAIEGDTAVMRNRWDSRFEVNIGDLKEK